MRQEIYRSINHLVEPTYFGKAAVKYGLSVKQVDELKREAEGNSARLNQLYFNAGFAAGRVYQNEEQSREVRNMTNEIVSIENINIQIITAHLPDGANGLCMSEGDDSYTIILNADIPEEKKQKAFLHEMFHIWNHDFDSKESVQQIEERAHSVIE